MSIYAGYPISTLRTWLSEAQAALPELVTGTQVISLALADSRLAFSPADSDKLRKHIEELQRDIAAAETVGSAIALASGPRRPILPWC
ncbi:MAG: hypothetical protein KDJ22_07170 [Candidatus Competibacteraceae bacterium]|nr:hypothetical protein [Candidatus Competibacteraceae bacterium]